MRYLRRAARTRPHEVYESSRPRGQWRCTKRRNEGVRVVPVRADVGEQQFR